MEFLLRTQRVLAMMGAGVALVWSGLAGVPTIGLWASVWLCGLTCIGVGAVVHELEKRNRLEGRQRNGGATENSARLVMVSGFGYLTVGMLAGWFHPVMTVVFLVVALLDFAARHPIARQLLRPSAQDNYPPGP